MVFYFQIFILEGLLRSMLPFWMVTLPPNPFFLRRWLRGTVPYNVFEIRTHQKMVQSAKYDFIFL